MTTPRTVRFSLDLAAEDYLAHYQGILRDVVVRAEDGRRVQFPAGALQRFITHQGIHGRFELRFDANNKLLDIRRLDED